MADYDFNLTDEVSTDTTADELDYNYTLDDNVVADLVKYTRSRTVKNEQQFMLTTLGYVSGFMETPTHFISGVLIGTAGSGKSHLQNTVEELFPDSYLYQATTGSETSIIYDDTWEDAYAASLDELQKPSDEIIEVLKSCFTKDTDVLTPNGVVGIAELEVGDSVYSWNPDTDLVEVKEVTDTIEKKNHHGELVSISNQYVNLSMTPDHTVWREVDRYGENEREFTSGRAEEVFSASSSQTHLPHTTVKDGEEIKIIDITEYIDCQYYTITGDESEFVTYDEGHSWVPRYYDGDDFLEYMAWYAAEGNIDNSSYGVCITQADASEIVNLVESLGPSYYHHDGRVGSSETVTIQNKVWQNVIENLCGRGWENKTLPEFVFDCSVEQKELVLDTLMKGDGDSTEGYHRYTTGSDDLKDCVLRLVLETKSPPYYRWDEESDVWRISTYENKQTVKSETVTRESHEGMVYCVTVEDNHTLVAGRNGRFSHVGNCHGGEDEEFRYKVTGGGKGADRDVDEIVRSAIPYWFLYAQYEPDFEMWDRLLKVPVHESKDKNEGVARSQWDHSLVSFGGDVDYLYDFEDGRLALKDHLREVPKDSWVKIPAGEEEFGWDAFEHARHIFDIGRSETNRVSSQIANLVRASALLNHEQREVRQLNVRNEGTKEAIVAEPQDLANVLACREVLLATTHQLDRKRKAICLAIQQAGGTQQAASIADIQSYLRKTNASFVERSQVEAMLDDLKDNYLVEKLEGAGENGRNLYQFQSWQSLGKFEINDEFKRVFSECHDPFSGNDFVETAREINEELTPSVSDFTSDAEVTSDSDEAQATLTSGEQQKVEVDLEPHEQRVAELLRENLDGEIITDLDEHDPSVRELLGLVPMGEPDDDTNVSNTVLDPDHEVWYHGPDEWIESVNDAEQEVEKAIRTLTMEGVFDTSTLKSRGGEPLEMKVSVKQV